MGGCAPRKAHSYTGVSSYEQCSEPVEQRVAVQCILWRREGGAAHLYTGVRSSFLERVAVQCIVEEEERVVEPSAGPCDPSWAQPVTEPVHPCFCRTTIPLLIFYTVNSCVAHSVQTRVFHTKNTKAEPTKPLPGNWLKRKKQIWF